MRIIVATAALVLAAIVDPAIATVHSIAPQVVQIALRDPSSDPALKGMQMQAEPTTVKAGRVTFKATNQSKELVHEVLVIPAPPAGKDLPYDAKSNTIIEKRAHSRGEISDLKPGAQGSLTLSLKPGTYLLVCNQAGHYKSGMFTKLTVEK